MTVDREWDLGDWLGGLEAVLAEHALGPAGEYRRWRHPDPAAGRNAGIDPYGCADAANLLWTLDRFPADAGERAAWVSALQGLQEPEGGFFREPTHHEIHTTAHCVASLELFDARPRHALAGLAGLEVPGALERFLDGLDWRDDPWLASHRGAGVYAARTIAGEASDAWRERYLDWLAREQDPETGLWRRDRVTPPYRWGESRFPHLAGTFHYLFNLESAGRPLRYPDRLVDTCLGIAAEDPWPLGATVSFAEIDWVYCLHRSVLQCGHRRAEAFDALGRFADRYVAYLLVLDLDADDGAGDLHRLFGAVCCLAELQRALPGRLRSERPLRLVLDRRPFI